VADHHPDPRREPVSVLLAEHEPEVAELSARYLRRDGLRVRLVTSPEPTLAELTAGPDAAAVLDLTMPGLDPRRIRRALRTPVIFLVADAKAPRPRGLAVRGDAAGARREVTGTRRDAVGARRWLARPFSPRQLVALVREVLADPGEPRPAVPRLNPALTASESAVLAALTDYAGRVLSRRQLLVAAGRQGAGDRAADVYIAQIRAKLGPAVRIRTVRGAGYALDPLPSSQRATRSGHNCGPLQRPGEPNPGGSHTGTGAAGLRSVAQQYRCEGTSEPRECARRDPRRRACRSRRPAAARLSGPAEGDGAARAVTAGCDGRAEGRGR
jgi:DNA-binding response OmpR family regulator